jgi:hypothetical protein
MWRWDNINEYIMTRESGRIPSDEDQKAMLQTLKVRFNSHMNRHEGLEWEEIEAKLKGNEGKLGSLIAMEVTGGEPDVAGYDPETGTYLFMDFSAESPEGRRSLCYDREAQDSRKANKPVNNALDMASGMGIEMLSEEQYRLLQRFGDFDTKTSSWIRTPPGIRSLGGALFADFRYGQVFICHNSAPSYYSSRGFRGLLRV